MSTFESLPSPTRRRFTGTARRSGSRYRPLLESMETRVVLSQVAAAPRAGAAQIRALAAAPPRQALSVPIDLTGLKVTSAAPDTARGVVNIAGTATGTLLGLPFTTPLSGVVRQTGGQSTLTLRLEPIDIERLGLSADTGPITFELTARRSPGSLDEQLRTTLSNVVRDPATGPAQLDGLLSNSGVLGALNRTLDRATTRVRSFTDGSGATPTQVRLTLQNTRVAVPGLNVRLAGARSGPVGLNVATTGTDGQLGALLEGLSGTARTLPRQLVGVFGQINSLSTALAPVLNPPPASTTPTTTVAATPTTTTTEGATTILDLVLNPIDVNLLGLQVKTSQINIRVSAQPGSGKLLGNLLDTVGGLLNLQGVNNALNNVLANVVTLVNGASLSVSGTSTTGPLGSAQGATDVQVVNVQVAPVHLDLLGATVDTSPIQLQIIAHPGDGQILGNVVAGLSNLLNGLGPDGKLDVPFVTGRLRALNSQLDAALPGIPAPVPAPTDTTFPAGREVLDLLVPPIDLNLLGLRLQTSTIEVNATAQTGDGKLLGNLLNGLLNALSATPEQIDALNGELNRLLARVVGVLNNASLLLPPDIVGTLTQVLQTLALPTLVTATPGATVPVLDLIVATPDTSPPVTVDLLGLVVTTSDIEAQLSATTGDGQILGNIVYNTAHLLDPGGLPGLLSILNALGV